jgi:Ras-related protein Rab-8A
LEACSTITEMISWRFEEQTCVVQQLCPLAITTMTSEMKFDLIVRVLLVGDRGAGKSCLQKRFVEDEFTFFFITSKDIQAKIIEVDGKRVKVQIWQVQGQEMVRPEHHISDYTSAHGVLVVYDVTDENSFLNIENWMKMIDRYAKSSIKRILVGTKIDQIDDRVIDVNRVQSIAEEYGLEFVECSAKTNQNVTETVTAIIRQIIKDGGGQPAVELSKASTNESKCW